MAFCASSEDAVAPRGAEIASMLYFKDDTHVQQRQIHEWYSEPLTTLLSLNPLHPTSITFKVTRLCGVWPLSS